MSEQFGTTEVVSDTRHAFCAVNSHCLERIVRLSDEMKVTASTDIIDDKGVRLWAKGDPVSRSLRETVRQRQLQRPLEASLAIEHGATPESIASDCIALMQTNPALERLGGTIDARRRLQDIGRIHLPPPLSLLLTSAREHQRRLYDVSLATMIISLGLAHSLGLGDNEAARLVLCALTHDIGEMYINPAYLDDDHQLQPAEWIHVAAHPCVGHAFIREFTDFPGSVAECVLQHHERVDGSGYPFRLAGEQISPFSTLIGLADTVAAIIMRSDGNSNVIGERVAMALHIVPGKFPRAAVASINHLLEALNGGTPPKASGTFAERILPTLQQIRSARLMAATLSGSSTTPDQAAIGEYALSTVRCIDKGLRATGVYDLSQLNVLEHNATAMGKICLMLDEVGWRLRNLARSLQLRAAQGEDALVPAAVAELVEVLNAPATAGSTAR